MNEQIKLIKEDINFIEKYYGTDNFNGLINDMLLHLKAIENKLATYKEKEDKIREYIKTQKDIVIKQPSRDDEIDQYFIDKFDCLLQILNEGK